MSATTMADPAGKPQPAVNTPAKNVGFAPPPPPPPLPPMPGGDGSPPPPPPPPGGTTKWTGRKNPSPVAKPTATPVVKPAVTINSLEGLEIVIKSKIDPVIAEIENETPSTVDPICPLDAITTGDGLGDLFGTTFTPTPSSPSIIAPILPVDPYLVVLPDYVAPFSAFEPKWNPESITIDIKAEEKRDPIEFMNMASKDSIKFYKEAIMNKTRPSTQGKVIIPAQSSAADDNAEPKDTLNHVWLELLIPDDSSNMEPFEAERSSAMELYKFFEKVDLVLGPSDDYKKNADMIETFSKFLKSTYLKSANDIKKLVKPDRADFASGGMGDNIYLGTLKKYNAASKQPLIDIDFRFRNNAFNDDPKESTVTSVKLNFNDWYILHTIIEPNKTKWTQWRDYFKKIFDSIQITDKEKGSFNDTETVKAVGQRYYNFIKGIVAVKSIYYSASKDCELVDMVDVKSEELTEKFKTVKVWFDAKETCEDWILPQTDLETTQNGTPLMKELKAHPVSSTNVEFFITCAGCVGLHNEKKIELSDRYEEFQSGTKDRVNPRVHDEYMSLLQTLIGIDAISSRPHLILTDTPWSILDSNETITDIPLLRALDFKTPEDIFLTPGLEYNNTEAKVVMEKAGLKEKYDKEFKKRVDIIKNSAEFKVNPERYMMPDGKTMKSIPPIDPVDKAKIIDDLDMATAIKYKEAADAAVSKDPELKSDLYDIFPLIVIEWVKHRKTLKDLETDIAGYKPFINSIMAPIYQNPQMGSVIPGTKVPVTTPYLPEQLIALQKRTVWHKVTREGVGYRTEEEKRKRFHDIESKRRRNEPTSEGQKPKKPLPPLPPYDVLTSGLLWNDLVHAMLDLNGLVETTEVIKLPPKDTEVPPFKARLVQWKRDKKYSFTLEDLALLQKLMTDKGISAKSIVRDIEKGAAIGSSGAAEKGSSTGTGGSGTGSGGTGGSGTNGSGGNWAGAGMGGFGSWIGGGGLYSDYPLQAPRRYRGRQATAKALADHVDLVADVMIGLGKKKDLPKSFKANQIGDLISYSDSLINCLNYGPPMAQVLGPGGKRVVALVCSNGKIAAPTPRMDPLVGLPSVMPGRIATWDRLVAKSNTFSRLLRKGRRYYK